MTMNDNERIQLAQSQIRMVQELIKSGDLEGLALELAESELTYNLEIIAANQPS